MSGHLGGRFVGGVITNMYPGCGWPGNRNVDVLQEPTYRLTYPYTNTGLDRQVDVLWVRSSFPNFPGGNGWNGLDAQHQNWEWCWAPTGCHVGKKISGVTRDSGGAAIGNVTVQLFNTSTGTLVDTVTSDGGGSYTAEDPNDTTNFAVGYLDGSPDTAGTTVNDLTGS